MLDEKKCYLFGRNPEQNDVSIEHSSCSRVHAALVYHLHLQRFFLIDLGSTHGTFVGSKRLEAHSPTQLPIDCTFHFGASSRRYTLREKPLTGSAKSDAAMDQDMVLPESELELDNLTEYNTANNKRVSVLPLSQGPVAKKRKQLSVSFREDEDVINPEDIDPSVGKFRNLIQTAVIPNKIPGVQRKLRNDTDHRILRPDHSDSSQLSQRPNPLLSDTLTTSLRIQLPNPAPNVVQDEDLSSPTPSLDVEAESSDASAEKKKKYAKESWPGRKASLF